MNLKAPKGEQSADSSQPLGPLGPQSSSELLVETHLTSTTPLRLVAVDPLQLLALLHRGGAATHRSEACAARKPLAKSRPHQLQHRRLKDSLRLLEDVRWEMFPT
mmetsp:Transcript_16324/g.35769  ORF Transcript_16324/g.35769 Transcript_16324/m.35769 type:complete len:105 (-) Transcript_16324:1126-1440(-)